MIARLLRWWPPHLRTEIALLRASLRLANGRHERACKAHEREYAERLRIQRELDKLLFDAEVRDFIGRDTKHKRLADGAGDL